MAYVTAIWRAPISSTDRWRCANELAVWVARHANPMRRRRLLKSPDPAVQAALADALVLQADVTAVDAEDQELMRRFGIIGPPTIMFFTADGIEQTSRRIVGFKPAADFATHVEAVFRGSPATTAVATNLN